MGTKKHRHLRLAAPPAPRDPAPTEWGSALDGELVTTVRRDGDRAVVLEAGDGVVRVRFLRLLAGRWQTTTDATLESLATVIPIARSRGLALVGAADELDPIDPAGGALALLARAA